ncbi:MAG: 30S ribosomal protein S6 [Sedimentisphaerales bacterium]|nr:30S ribosomal protein S6 [Sedimentisphaerales bacterium]
MNRKLYESMFLVDSGMASDWDATIKIIEGILKRVEAEIVSIRKWDDRRLAYEVQGKSRGTYILCYFRVEGERIQEIEKTVQLSENIMRVLILSAEHMTAEDLEKDTPATKSEKESAAAGEDKGDDEDETAVTAVQAGDDDASEQSDTETMTAEVEDTQDVEASDTVEASAETESEEPDKEQAAE